MKDSNHQILLMKDLNILLKLVFYHKNYEFDKNALYVDVRKIVLK